MISPMFRTKGNKEVTILSLDGGGIRGIIPITVLIALQKEMVRLGIDRPLYSCFDLIAGTSTGALIALGLCAPDPENPEMPREPEQRFSFRRKHKPPPLLPAMTLESILDLYEHRSPDIFSKGPLGQLGAVTRMFMEKYDEHSLTEILQEIYGSMTINEALAPLIITAYECTRGEPFLFRSYRGSQYLMKDAARAATAAPTYFSPAFITDPETGKELCFIDGGVAANNPSLYAYLEAKQLYPQAEKFHIFSIGTAGSLFALPMQGLRRMGILDWISPAKGVPLLHVYTSGQYHTAEHVMKTLPEVTYHRIAGNKGKHPVPMDDVSKGNILRLKRAAQYIARSHEDVIQNYCRNYLISR